MFLKGEDQESGISHHLVTFLNRSLKDSGCFQQGGPWLRGLLTYLVLERQPGLVY